MAASFRVVGAATAFTDKTEHALTLTDNVAAGETVVFLAACSVTDINGIVGYVDANDGTMTTTADCATQTTWQKDVELGAAGGGGYNGLSCFSSYIKTGLTSGDTIRFGVKHGSGGTFDASGFYHGQSPYAMAVALNSGDGRAMVFDVGDSVATSATTTPASPSITTADEAIVLGLFGGSVQAGAGWFTPGSGWTELADTAQGTESNYNIAAQGRIATTSFSGTSNGTSAASKQFGTLVVSYKATSAAQSPGPTVLAGRREVDYTTSDFFSNGNTAAFPFVASASGTSARMGGRFSADNTGITTVKLGVYTHDSGNNRPGTLIASGSVTINPVNMVAFGAPVVATLTNGTTYWLAFSGAGEQVDISGLSSSAFGREGAGNMVGTWSAAGNMGVKASIWIETADPGPPVAVASYRPVQIANPRVGPQALRMQMRKHRRRLWSTGTSTAPQTFPQALTATSVVVTASMQRQTNKGLTATAVAATASMQRQVSKILSATAVVATATIQKQVNKTLTATAVVVTASLLALKVILKTLTATAVVVTATMQKQVNKPLTATTVAVTATIQKQVNKTLTATAVAVTATLQALKVILKTMTATAVVVTATMSRQVQLHLSATVAVTASIRKLVTKTLSASSAVIADMTAIKGGIETFLLGGFNALKHRITSSKPHDTEWTSDPKGNIDNDPQG